MKTEPVRLITKWTRAFALAPVMFCVLMTVPSPAQEIRNCALDEQLLRAAARGDLTAARGLLEKGAKVDAFDRKHGTALMWAARTGNLELLKLLVDNGSEICCRRRAHRPRETAS